MAAKSSTATETQKRNPETIHAIQHIEIVANDPVKFSKFAEKQFGWKIETMKMPGMDYHTFRTPDGNGGGIMAPQNGQPVAATPYINVSDINATLKNVQKGGATIMMPVTEVPGMGKFFWFQFPGAPPLACWQSTAARN